MLNLCIKILKPNELFRHIKTKPIKRHILKYIVYDKGCKLARNVKVWKYSCFRGINRSIIIEINNF